MNPTTQPIMTMNVSTMNTCTKPKIKNSYKNMMADFMKPLPKEDKPNIHLGGGTFSKLDKI
uniref:Uncharacterized protein n=1 Tax=viral metagenome TaxID=1070528 RepID=A0A6C0JIU6_9ZZZZ